MIITAVSLAVLTLALLAAYVVLSCSRQMALMDSYISAFPRLVEARKSELDGKYQATKEEEQGHPGRRGRQGLTECTGACESNGQAA